MQKPKMKSELVEITPQLATKWLELNVDNRNVSDAWVDAIAQDIREGKWDPNNASLGMIVDQNGTPIKVADGQHRLWAVVNADKAIWTWVVFGDEENLRRENIDRVKPRSIADQLQLLYHIPNARKISAYCGILLALEEKREIGSKVIMTLEKALEVRSRHETSIAWMISVVNGASGPDKKRVEKSLVAGPLIYAHPTDPTRIDIFTKQVRDGENLTKHDPAYALRSWLDRASSQFGGAFSGSQSDRHHVVVATMRAVISYLNNEKLSIIRDNILTEGSFYKDAIKVFARAQRQAIAPIVRKAGN